MGPRNWRRTPLIAIAGTALLILPAAALGVVGDFTQPATSPEAAGSGAISVAAGNFNGDANVDLAVADPAPSGVTVMLGNGSGDFTPAATSPETETGDFPIGVVAANLNGDANIDLATANLLDGNVSILLGDGTGDFAEVGSSPEVATDAFAITAANLDGDADTDLAVANRDSDDVSILLNNGSGDFTVTQTSPGMVGDGPDGVVAANLDGDADVDLATANLNSDNVSVLLNNGSGSFTTAPTSPEAAGDAARTIAAADLDGNGSADLAVGNAGAGAVDDVSILLNNGSADFTAGAGSPEAVEDEPRSIAAANLNGDTQPDLAVANSDSDSVSILLNISTPDVSPSNEFSFGKVKLNKKKGTAKLPVTVPGPGTLDLAGGGLKPQRPAAARVRAEKPVTGAGTVKLAIKPTGNKKKKLNKAGKVKVKAKVTFTPTGGSSNTQTKKIKLKKS